MSILHIRIKNEPNTIESDQILKQVELHKEDIYVWAPVHSYYLKTKKVIELLVRIRKLSQKELYLICRSSSGLKEKYLGYTVIDFCWTGLEFMRAHKIFNQNYLNDPTNGKDTFLFLMGKPIGYHRIGLLYKIWQKKLVDKCQYSLFHKVEDLQKKSFEYINKQDQLLFFNSLKIQSPDNIKVSLNGIDPINSHIFVGIPYSTSMYEQTKFSIVSETYGWPGPPYFITEKTWRPILNCHPFLLAGQPGIVNYLESLGFDCYRSFLKKDYDKKISEWNHVDNENLIQNIKHWLSMDEHDWQKVKIIAKNNQKIFLNYMEKSENIFRKLVNSIKEKSFLQSLYGDIQSGLPKRKID